MRIPPGNHSWLISQENSCFHVPSHHLYSCKYLQDTLSSSVLDTLPFWMKTCCFFRQKWSHRGCIWFTIGIEIEMSIEMAILPNAFGSWLDRNGMTTSHGCGLVHWKARTIINPSFQFYPRTKISKTWTSSCIFDIFILYDIKSTHQGTWNWTPFMNWLLWGW